MRRGSISIVALALLALSGCGGGGNANEHQIRDVYGNFQAAIQAGDSAKACSFLTPAAQQQTMASTAKLLSAHLPGEPPGLRRPHRKFPSCAAAVRELLRAYRAGHAQLGAITINGRRATATVVGRAASIKPGPTALQPDQKFTKVAGQWKLDRP